MHSLRKINTLTYGLLVSVVISGSILAMDKLDQVGGPNANQHGEMTFDSQKKEIEELTRKLEASQLENKKLKLQLALKDQEEENNKLAQRLVQTTNAKGEQGLQSSSITTKVETKAWRERLKVTPEMEEEIKTHIKSLGLVETEQLMEVCLYYGRHSASKLPNLADLRSLDNAATCLKELKIPTLAYYKIKGAQTCLIHFPELKGSALIDRLVVAMYFNMAGIHSRKVKEDIEDNLSKMKVSKVEGEDKTEYEKYSNMLFDRVS